MNIKYFFSIWIILLTCATILAQDAEYISNFEVDIHLNKDRSIDVIENIEVYVLGDKIKRGITRSFPLSRFANDKKVSVDYQDMQISKNGIREPFFSKTIDNNQVYYLGAEDVFLTPGKYNYTLKYTVPNQIISTKDNVQLLWNAIGTDIVFKSEYVKVTITLEEDMNLQNSRMYVGKFGSGQDASRVNESSLDNQIVYNVPGGLLPNEAATIEVNLSTASVMSPGFFQKYSSLLTIIFGGIAMCFYFLITWFKFGKDPKHDASALLYDTPDNLSPASISYIHKESYSSRALTSSFISLALKGFINISKEGGQSMFSKEIFVIKKLKEATNDLPAEQHSLLSNLFVNGSVVYLDGEYNLIVKNARRSHQVAVLNQHQDFVQQGNNQKFVLYAVVILILVVVASTILANTIEINHYPHLGNLAIFVPISIIGIFVYRYLIVQPTVEKLNLQEEIRAFKQYIEMNVAEQSQLANAPERDIAHFESLLPYAYALDVESKWSDSFSKLLDESNYAPQWSGGYFYASGLHHGLSSGVRSTATKPQPSGGGSGGGGGSFSGGGGGGGGVGGW